MGSAPRASNASTVSRLPFWAARWSAVRPSAVVGAAERAARTRVDPAGDQVPDGGDAPARGGPGERGAAVDVAVERGAPGGERVDRLHPVVARGPGHGFVERLLRVLARRPGGEAAVWAVERARRAGRGLDRLDQAEPGGGAEVHRRHPTLGEELRGRAVAPEQRDDQRRAACAARGDIDTRAGVEQHLRHHREVAVGGLVQCGPAVGVRVGDVRSVVEQEPDEPFVARGAGHPQQVVAVGPARGGELREAREQRAERVEIMRLDGAIRPRERLARVAQARDVALQCRPIREAVLNRNHRPRALMGERHAPEQRHRARRPVHSGSEQALGATLVVLDILVVRVLEPGTVRGQPLHVGLQPRPAREPVLARDRQLGVAELERTGAREILGLLAQLLEIGSEGKRWGRVPGHASARLVGPRVTCCGDEA